VTGAISNVSKTSWSGPRTKAVELYPAESRKVDTANQFHLWVLADPTQRWPIGFNEQLVVTADLEPSSSPRILSL
jgi:hypothetical protein